MLLKKYSSRALFICTCSVFIWFVCTEPTEPRYKVTLDNQEIQTEGTSILNTSFVLSVSASGSTPVYYQWIKDNTPIQNENSDSLVLSPLLTTHAGNYKCAAWNDLGGDTTLAYALSVYIPPTIATHPQDDSITVGDSATFTVSATGTPPLSFQWQKNGSDISGASDSMYTTPTVTMNDNNSEYRCVITNDYGSVTSNSADLTVTQTGTKPEITTDPQNQSVVAGSTATFSVSATGTAPLQYQWEKNGTAITGGTDSVYTTPPTTKADSGATFRCIVSNSAGMDTSGSAILSVTDNIVKPDITGQPQDITINEDDSAVFSVTATGTSPLSFQWQRNDTNLVNDTGISYTLRNATPADSGATFRCIVSNSAGKDTSDYAVLSVNRIIVKPDITQDPQNRSVVTGSTATFSVTATGTAPLQYQWQKNDTAITGATDSTYTTPATTKANALTTKTPITVLLALLLKI